MGRLAAGGGAGIQHPLAGPGIQQLGGTLGAPVLNRDKTVEKAGQGIHRHRLLQQQGGAAQGRSGNPGGFQASLVFLPGAPGQIDPQGHGRLAVAGRGDGFPIPGIGPAQAGQPPVGMPPGPRRLAGGPGQQLGPLPQITAQHAVDHPAEIALGQGGGSGHGLVHHRVALLRPALQAVQGAQQQALQLGFGQGLLQQGRQHRLAPAITAQGAVGQILGLGPGRPQFTLGLLRQHFGQAASGLDGGNGCTGQQQGAGQGIGCRLRSGADRRRAAGGGRGVAGRQGLRAQKNR